MELKRIEELYRYDRWANSRILDAASTLGQDQFVSAVTSGFPSLRETLVHILWAEWIWLRRWKGTSPTTVFAAEEFADASALRSRWREVEDAQAEFVRSLAEDRLSTVIRYVNTRGQTWEYELWKQMLHVVNHSSYHRGQVATLLRQLGAQPPATDLLVFYDEVP